MALLAASSPAAPDIGDYAWLAGCWRLQGDESGMTTEEHWMAPAGGLMLGMSRTLREGDAVGWEFVRIVEDFYGTRFIASPSGQTAVEFFLLSDEEDTLVFENKEHDFPQRIVYQRQGERHLLAWAEGEDNEGARRRYDFSYERKPCDD